jgi:hypothetical protein
VAFDILLFSGGRQAVPVQRLRSYAAWKAEFFGLDESLAQRLKGLREPREGTPADGAGSVRPDGAACVRRRRGSIARTTNGPIRLQDAGAGSSG